MRKVLVAGIILLAMMGAAIAEPGNGNGNGQSGQTDPGNSGDAPGQQTGDNSGQGQGGNPSNGNNGSNDGSQGNAGQGGDDQGDESDDSGDGDQNQGDDQGENGQDDQGDDGGDVEGDGSQDQVDDQEENDQGGDDQGDDAEDSGNDDQEENDQGNDDQVDDQEENNPVEDALVNDLIHDDGQIIPHDEELLRIALRELAHPAPGPTCRLVMTANLTRATITNECAAPADIGSMVLSQAEHIAIGSTPDGRYILGPGQSYGIDIQAHVGTLRLTGVGGYGEYAVCEVTA